MTASATIKVASTGRDRTRGLLMVGGTTLPCALGRTGIRRVKREGDGATPVARMPLLSVFYRADRLVRPRTGLRCRPIEPWMGWCDDPRDRAYNRPVRLPYAGSHENMWRKDHLYDIVVILDYNLAKPRRGAGSAIFFHLAAPGFAPTAGCVAVNESAMRRVLARCHPGATMMVR